MLGFPEFEDRQPHKLGLQRSSSNGNRGRCARLRATPGRSKRSSVYTTEILRRWSRRAIQVHHFAEVAGSVLSLRKCLEHTRCEFVSTNRQRFPAARSSSLNCASCSGSSHWKRGFDGFILALPQAWYSGYCERKGSPTGRPRLYRALVTAKYLAHFLLWTPGTPCDAVAQHSSSAVRVVSDLRPSCPDSRWDSPLIASRAVVPACPR